MLLDEQHLMVNVHMQAGVDGQQNLPDSFQVARATGSEAPQSVYINRELDLDVWQLADKARKPDPSACCYRETLADL